MDFSTPKVVSAAPASKGWFTAAKLFLWLASFDFASFFLGFIFMWPFGGPKNPNYLLIAALIVVVIGFIFLVYRAMYAGLQRNDGFAKVMTAVFLAPVFLAFLYPCLPIAIIPVIKLFTR